MRDSRRLWVVLLLPVGCALLVQCRAGSTAAPALGTETPAAVPEPTTSPLFTSPLSPIPAPSPTPVAQGDGYKMQAWTLFSRTQVDSIQEVSAKLTKEGEGVAGAQMYAVVHYGGKDYRHPVQGSEATNEKGIATVRFSAADAAPETTVEVDVYVTYDETSYHSAVSFMANC
jgi:hypothetical protein